MYKRIITASLILLFAGIIVTISANELPAQSAQKDQFKTTIFFGK